MGVPLPPPPPPGLLLCVCVCVCVCVDETLDAHHEASPVKWLAFIPRQGIRISSIFQSIVGPLAA